MTLFVLVFYPDEMLLVLDVGACPCAVEMYVQLVLSAVEPCFASVIICCSGVEPCFASVILVLFFVLLVL